MKYIYIISLAFYTRVYSIHLTTAANQKPAHCQSSNRNALIEHFFNTIFSEFYATPPVCVCVQMCPGESTYCYPNGCLKGATTVREDRDEATKKTDVPSPTTSQALRNKQFMFVTDEKYDFMNDFLERNYADDSKTGTEKVIPAQDLRPDPFKDKYSVLGKLKKLPKVEFRYNIKEQVKNSKSDLMKNDGIDLTKIRWPMKLQRISHKHDTISGIGKANFFTKMLVDNNVAEYPPKYFKRDLTKTTTDEDEEGKAFYDFENSMNGTDTTNFSLESLIDTLIKNSYSTNADETGTAKEDDRDMESNATPEKVISGSSTSIPNEPPKVISMNFTNENVEKNKYAEDSAKLNRTRNLNEMITYLENQIDKENNTSMEIAKRVVGNYAETTPSADINVILKSKLVESVSTNDSKLTAQSTDSLKHAVLATEMSTSKGIQVTKKNRQRFVRKLSSSKFT